MESLVGLSVLTRCGRGKTRASRSIDDQKASMKMFSVESSGVLLRQNKVMF